MTTKEKKAEEKKAENGREFQGVVVSDKMKDTAVVAVTRFAKHPKYGKFIKHVKKFHAHNPGNEKVEGDKVRIKECRPISKMKKFKIVSQ